MAFKYILIIAIVAAEDSKTLFKWDINNLEDVFCEKTLQAFKNEIEGQTKSDASQFLKKDKDYKKGRRHMQIWPWEYHDSFEGECIEEVCKTAEITEFCSRRETSLTLQNEEDNTKLTDRRRLRYEYCEMHVSKTVDSIKGTSNQNNKEIDAWRKELTPARLFRGWWEELKKAYKRFCLQDMSDCARRCNVEHGTCRLREQRSENEADKWQYGCSCDPGYAPWTSENLDDQVLCRTKITNADLEKCGPLQTVIDSSSHARNQGNDDEDGPSSNSTIAIPIDHNYLCKHLNPDIFGDNCVLKGEESKRKKRVTNSGSELLNLDAQYSFFPSAVEIKHTPYCNLDAKKGSQKKDCKPPKKSENKNIEWAMHVCGGTLLVTNQKTPGKTNMVVTAAHCFCDKLYDINDTDLSTYTVSKNCEMGDKNSCVRNPKPGHYFIRIGIIDNKAPLNLFVGQKDEDKTNFYKVPVDAKMKYIDVRVKDIILRRDDYATETNCAAKSANGGDDLAVLILDGYVDVSDKGASVGLRNHVKPACSIYESGKTANDLIIGNNRCFVAGWGKSRNETSEFSLANTLKYTKVEILDPQHCKDGIRGDSFLETLDTDNLDQIVCAKGVSDTNTCGGDSGGGLYCFNESGKQYYFMGPLHGGSDNCEIDDLMYFTNINYDVHRSFLQSINPDKAKTRRSIDEL